MLPDTETVAVEAPVMLLVAFAVVAPNDATALLDTLNVEAARGVVADIAIWSLTDTVTTDVAKGVVAANDVVNLLLAVITLMQLSMVAAMLTVTNVGLPDCKASSNDI